SRYLWKNEGILPEHFRASMTESPPHIDQILPYLTTFFQIASNELQKEARLNLQSLEKTQTSILDTSFKSHPHLIEKVAPYSLSIERKCKTFKQLVYRPVALDQISGTQSLLIRTAVHNIPFYLTGMRQILPSFFSNRYSYPQISFTLQKVTLLLEQSLKVAIGRLGDEVIQSESGRNIVCEHQLDTLNAHLEKSIPEEGLSLTESEEKTLFTLRRFLFAEGRYLSTYSQDNLGKTLVSIRDKCHNLQRYRKGFYTPVEEKEFKARFGSKQETWTTELEKELESLINAEIYPLVFDALTISEKLLTLAI
ncbi:MAG: hypothetical protein KDK63_02455, partial [Chlamydiia bacterium]|nr:hypothetical protein [Chlamydiia bacterium]